MLLATIFISIFSVSVGFIMADYFACQGEIKATMEGIESHNAELNRILIETRLINKDI